MSHLKILKRKKTFKTNLTLIASLALTALLSANTAIADPDKEIAAPEQITEQVTEGVKKNAQDQMPNLGKDEMSGIDTEGTIDEDKTDIAEEPVDAQTPMANEPPIIMDKQNQSIVVIPVEKNKQGCYPQDDGAIECVCETKAACEALKSSDICDPNTHWGNSDGFGGCTKKVEQ